MLSAVPSCLVVEDSELDRNIMERVLARQSRPCRVIFARSLGEARGVLKAETVAIIFLDNSLPDGYGADFLSELSCHPTAANVPVILVSDWPSPFMYAKARAKKVRDIWSKREFTVDRVQTVMGQVRLLA